MKWYLSNDIVPLVQACSVADDVFDDVVVDDQLVCDYYSALFLDNNLDVDCGDCDVDYHLDVDQDFDAACETDAGLVG